MLYFVLIDICIENVENVKLGEQVGEFTKSLWSRKLEFFIANFKLKDVSTYHPAARRTRHKLS